MADVLPSLGVTMEEHGVSKLVSVKFRWARNRPGPCRNDVATEPVLVKL